MAWCLGFPLIAAEVRDARPYLDAVRQFADQTLARGRDVYGRPTPLFVDGIDVDTGKPVTWKWADGAEWVLCNLANQQGLFRLLDGLSRLTDEPRYRNAALEAYRYAFGNLRFGTNYHGGLLAWGGHLAYNASDDVLAGNPDGTGRIHELKTVFPHYELMWEADPRATRELIENIWNGHVLDWATLDFNRHGNPNARGVLWSHAYQGGPVFFWGKGLTFHNAGSDFYYAAGMLYRLSGDPRSLEWARRLSHRYAETRDPRTRLEGFQFSQSDSAWCDDAGTIRGDRAQYQYGEDFPGHRVVEGTLFPCYGNTPMIEPQVGRLLLAEALGESGREFRDQAVIQLTAWGKAAYRARDNVFIPMLTDGTSLEGYVSKKDGYFGPKGRVHTAGNPGPNHLWAYALGFRLSGEPYLWEMLRNIVRGNGWGELGETPQKPSFARISETASNPRLLLAWLELYRATGDTGFLDAAEQLGRNMIQLRIRNGWFVPSLKHRYSRLAHDESQALLYLLATLRGRPGSIPAFTGAEPFFHAEYGTSTGRVYDTEQIYGQTR